MAKPRIRFDKFIRQYECFTWENLPGERCMISGTAETPHGAYLEWVKLNEIYSSRVNQAVVT